MREFLAVRTLLAVLVVLLTGCAEPAAEPGATGVAAMDENTGLQLLAMGTRPVAVAARPGTVTTEMLRETGIPLVPQGNVEAIASRRPALVVGMMTPRNEEVVAQLRRIGPVVLTNFTDPWPDQLRVFAAATGRIEQAERMIGRLDAAIDQLAARVAASRFRGGTVSVLARCGGGSVLCTFDDRTMLGAVLRRVGFRRPSLQMRAYSPDDRTAWAGFDTISAELLGEHGGDVIIALDDQDGPTILDHPLLRTEHAVTARVDFDGWYYNTPLSMGWVLHDLRAILFGEGRVAEPGDAPALWAEAVR